MNNLQEKKYNKKRAAFFGMMLFIVANVFFMMPIISRAAPLDDFVITVKTDNPGSSTNTQFTIPTTGAGYDYNVDCDNDGVDDATGQTGNYTCNYALAGTYKVRIKDNTGAGTGFPRIYFNGGGDGRKLLGINQWGTGTWTSMERAFYGCSNLNDGGGWASDNPDLSSVTNMQSMFEGATAFNQNIGGWNTGAVTNMQSMFSYAAAFNQNIGGWNTNYVTNMQSMFEGATTFNQNIGGWDVEAVTNMQSMFRNASAFNQGIGGWDVGNVTSMWSIFRNASTFNQTLDLWEVDLVTSMGYMFTGSNLTTSNYDSILIGWNSRPSLQNNVTLSSPAHYCNSVTQRQNIIDTYTWTINDAGQDCGAASIDDFVITVKTNNTGTSTNTQFTIPTTGVGYDYNVDCDSDGANEATGINGDYTCNYASAGIYVIRIKRNDGGASGTAWNGFPRIYVNNSGDREKILSVEQWGTGIWTSMENAFMGAINVDGFFTDIPDLSSVTNLKQMFYLAHEFDGDVSAWNTSTITNMAGMFYEASKFNQDLSGWTTDQVTDMSYMFHLASVFNQDISSWVTNQVTNMSHMFYSDIVFDQDLSSWNTSLVTDMAYMFGSELGSTHNFNHNISGWDTGLVTDMSYMFFQSYNFDQDISSWNVDSVSNMEHMFHYATSFNRNLGAWHVDNVANMTDMFSGTALEKDEYDNTLIGWNARPSLQNNVTLDSPATYCASEAQRQNIITTYSWTINDAGLDGGCGVAAAPTVTTQNATIVSSNIAIGNGTVTNTGTIDPERFIQWGTVSGTYTNECSAGIDGVGTYSCMLTGLVPSTVYFVRAKAINSQGTSYGLEVNFTTPAATVLAPSQVKIRGGANFRGSVKMR
jgi:surface protein